MNLKIVFTGPESSGKTTLSQWVATEYQWPYVKEMAREYLSLRSNVYDQSSLWEIARLQRWEEIYHAKSGLTIICDTDLLTILIWFDEKFGHIPSELLDLWKHKLEERIYFLCSPDIPWEYDIQRENPHDRDRLFGKYLDFLATNAATFYIVNGNIEHRMHQVESILSKK